MASTSAGRIVQGFDDDHDHGKLIGLHFVRLHSLNKAELDDVIGDLLGKDNGTGRYRVSLAEPYNRRVLLKVDNFMEIAYQDLPRNNRFDAGRVIQKRYLCRPLVSDPEYLGGAPTCPKYLVDNLCRSASLPTQTFKIKNKEAKRAFLRIYNGDFLACWSSSQDSFDLWVENTDSNVPPELKGVLIHATYQQTTQQERLAQKISDFSSIFSNTIRWEDKLILAHHAAHHFLRQHGSRLSTKLFVVACKSLAQGLGPDQHLGRSIVEAPRIKEAQNIFVLLIDGLSTLEISEETTHHVVKMGESLEAIQMFVEAAKVYERLIGSEEG